jgi:hypothetical protein
VAIVVCKICGKAYYNHPFYRLTPGGKWDEWNYWLRILCNGDLSETVGYAILAQLAEHLALNERVVGSTPTDCTMDEKLEQLANEYREKVPRRCPHCDYIMSIREMNLVDEGVWTTMDCRNCGYEESYQSR